MEVARMATGTGVTGVYKTGAEAETVAFFCHAYNLWDSCAGQEMSHPSLNKWIKHILCAFFLRNPQKIEFAMIKAETLDTFVQV